MAFDFKKEYKEFYLPKQTPVIITVPRMNYIAVQGVGDPNEVDGAYQQALSVLYAVAYTLKMSPRAGYTMKGFFDYVVPPLEGFWWQEGTNSVNGADKASFNWRSVIRLPDFVTRKDVDWAVRNASQKKKMDCSAATFFTLEEGLCVQMMHLGSYDDEPASMALMDDYIANHGYESDLCDTRRHHEIYLSDPRKTSPEKRKTVLRHPIKPLVST